LRHCRVRFWQLALAGLAGNLLLHQLPALPGPGVLLVLTLAALALLAHSRGGMACVPAIAVLAFCGTAVAARDGLGARWPAAADGDDVAVTGWIDELPTRDAGRTVFSLRVESAAAEPAPRRIRLSWYDPAPALAAGQALEVIARLRAPRGLANPGGFDYERWLFVEGYDATGYVREGSVVPGRRYGLAQAWLEFRAALGEGIARRFADPDAAALVTALGLGERQGFGERHWTALQRTGTSHLVAVSGLHIGLIAALAFALLRRLALRLPYAIARHALSLAALGCLLPAAAYAALAGFSLPTQRALVMLVVAQAVIVSRRSLPLPTGFAIALVLVLLLDPLASLTASFWLSFGAVGLLLAAVAAPRPAANAKASHSEATALRPDATASRLRRYLAELGRLQWLLTLGLAPLTIHFFGQLSLAAYVVNLIAIPLFSLVVVPLSLLTVLAIGAGIDVAVLVATSEFVAAWAWRGIEFAARPEIASIALPQPPLPALLVAGTALLLSLPRHRLPGRSLLLVTLVPLVVRADPVPEPGEFRATVLDVGHGLAVAIETASHRAVYDAGPVYRSGFDAGAEIVGPALAELGRAPLDLIVISHGDSDHAGGLSALRARYPGVRLVAGPDVEAPGAEPCRAGRQFTWDRVRFEFLHPPAGFAPLGNESSCVLRIEADAGTLLLTGDIENRGEAALLRAMPGAVDVVVVPHHGSLTSSSRALVAAFSPALAIASAGFNNRWGFPRPEVRERWEAAGAIMLATGDTGAIELSFGQDSIDVRAARDFNRRYWQPKRDPVSGAIGRSAL
jgi:competence protein ComEC